MLVVNLHLTDDEVGVFAEGFRNLFVSTDDEIDAWINKDVNIIGTCSLPEFLARRTFTIIFPGGQAEMDHIDNVALLLAVPATGIISEFFSPKSSMLQNQPSFKTAFRGT